MAKKPVPGTAVKQYDAELAALAAGAAETEASVMLGSFISLKAGVMSFKGNAIPGNKMTVCVLDAILENLYYDVDYDPDAPATPVCFAFGRVEKELKPHAESEQPQHEQCKGCPQNEFGTANRGKGKACKNGRRLLLLTEGDLESAETVDAAEAAQMKVPVTSIKAWAGYVQQLNDTMQKPPLAVLTEISVTPDAKTQFKVSFNYIGEVDPALIGNLLAKRKACEGQMVQPYKPMEKKEAPAKTPARAQKFRR